MASLSTLYAQKEQYYVLADKVNGIVRLMDPAITSLQDAEVLSTAYQIDQERADGAALKKMTENLASAKAKAQSLLSEIESAISQVNHEIAEEEERIRKEEEAKARAQNNLPIY